MDWTVLGFYLAFLLMFVKFDLLLTFLLCISLKTFSTDLNSAENCCVFVLGHFLNLEAKRIKKLRKRIYSKCVLDFTFAPNQSVRVLFFLKKSNLLYPTVYVSPILLNQKQKPRSLLLLSIKRRLFLSFMERRRLMQTSKRGKVTLYCMLMFYTAICTA
jgi:hypothetical protein